MYHPSHAKSYNHPSTVQLSGYPIIEEGRRDFLNVPNAHERLKALIDAVKHINNGEVEIPEDSEDLNESEKESSGADENVDDEDLDLDYTMVYLYWSLLAHMYLGIFCEFSVP